MQWPTGAERTLVQRERAEENEGEIHPMRETGEPASPGAIGTQGEECYRVELDGLCRRLLQQITMQMRLAPSPFAARRLMGNQTVPQFVNFPGRKNGEEKASPMANLL